MNKFRENECLPNFGLKFKFLENLRKLLILKSTRKRFEEKKMAETREESQTTVLAKENQTSIEKENQTGLSPFEEPKTNKSVF